MWLVYLGLYIDVLSVSMRFSVIFCIYEHILKIYLGMFRLFKFSKFRKHVVWPFRSNKCSPMVPRPIPIPIPGVSKSLLSWGASILEQKKTYFRWFVIIYEIKNLPGGLTYKIKTRQVQTSESSDRTGDPRVLFPGFLKPFARLCFHFVLLNCWRDKSRSNSPFHTKKALVLTLSWNKETKLKNKLVRSKRTEVLHPRFGDLFEEFLG